jgi:hypothetical protein
MSVIITSAKERLKPIGSGSLFADGTEQTLLEFNGIARITGYVDLSNMTIGDTIIIRQYMKLTSKSNYKKYAEQTLTGVQPEPVLYITPKETDVAILITLQQTTGVFKEFPYNFMEED